MRVSSFSILTFLFVTLLSFIAMSTQRADAAACTRNADGEIIDGDINPSCTVTPDAVYFPIYKFGLCENVPTYDNYQSSCTMLFDSATAAVVEVTPTSNFNLAENLTITEGVYKAAIVLLVTQSKFVTAKFSMKIGMGLTILELTLLVNIAPQGLIVVVKTILTQIWIVPTRQLKQVYSVKQRERTIPLEPALSWRVLTRVIFRSRLLPVLQPFVEC